MNIEQTPPNKPNFGLIVGLSAAAIIVLLVLAVLFIHWDGKHLTFGVPSQASLVVPHLPHASASRLYRSTPV